MSKSTAKKILKITGIIVAAIVLIAIAALLYINHNAGKIADNELRKALGKSKLNEVYHIDWADLDVNILSGNVKLKGFKLTPREDFYVGSDSLRFANPMLIDATIPKFTVKGFKIGPELDFSDLSFESIVIDEPQIILITHLTRAEQNKLRSKLAKAEVDTTNKTPSINTIKLDDFRIEDGSFSVFRYLEKKTIIETGSINLRLKKITLEPGHLMRAILNRTFEESYIQVKDLYYHIDNGFYDIKLGEFDLSIEDNAFELNDIEVIPKYSKAEFSKKLGKQSDRFDVIINKIEVVNFDLNDFILDNKIEIEKIVISGANAELYRDKNIPFDTTAYPPLPNQILGRLDQYVNIGKIEIKKSRLVYEEFVPKAEMVGKVPIGNLHGTIYNVTNDAALIKKNGPMKWDAQGEVFDAALLKLVVEFPADLNAFSFKFHGSLAKMDMTAFNVYTKSNLKLEISAGTIDSLIYTADAGNDHSNGTMVMAYKDLKLNVLKEYTGEIEKKKGFLSGIANMVVKSHNPKKEGDPPTPAEIFFVPDKHKAIINYMVKSLINGIVGSMVPAAAMTQEKYDKKQDKEHKKEESVEEKETRHQKKETKKEERQRKRQEKKEKKK